MIEAFYHAFFCVSLAIVIHTMFYYSYVNWIILNLPEWLHKPLGACVKCTGGQIALWTSTFMKTKITFGMFIGLNVTTDLVFIFTTTIIAIAIGTSWMAWWADE